jgi:hypothetical protein
MRKHRAKRQIFVPYNGKIADITESDTNKHFLDLATALSENRKIIAIILGAMRIAGTGFLYPYPNEGTANIAFHTNSNTPLTPIIIADGTQRLQYALTVANDDFDMYCYGYIVEV